MNVQCKCGANVTIGGMMLAGGVKVDLATATASIATQLGWTTTAKGWRCANCTVAAKGRRS